MDVIEPGWGFAVNTFFRDDADERAQARTLLALGPMAEQAGFDSVWVGDHVLWHTPILDALTTLSAYAASTDRVRLGTAILLLGLRQPAIATKTLTTLNLISNDRLVLGVGVGGEFRAEFDLCGVAHAQRGRLLDEALRFLLAQWDRDPSTPGLSPRGARPPVFIGGASDATWRRVREFDAGWLGAWVSPRRIRQEASRQSEGRDIPMPIALNVYLCVDEDGNAARSAAAEFLGTSYGTDPAPLLRHSIAGTVAECAEQLAAYAEAGVGHFVLRPATWDQQSQLDRWGEYLLPQLADIPLPGNGG
jgi:alkanesulfonate monooxygenase SsuD/methylene tetrahydromethanopterin reductase-like flavin-dependent oxidoreductase (luciferase family)